jgi:sulfide:quinone oxidoreductase
MAARPAMSTVGCMTSHTHDRVRVVIAGGGVAALETLLALRTLAGQRVELTLVCAEREFLYRPVTVAEAFDRGEARAFGLAEIVEGDCSATLIRDSLARVDSDAKEVVTGSGQRVAFDALVVATGAVATEPFPGALTFRGRVDVPALRDLLAQLADGRARSVAFALPSQRIWPLPLYELALMTAGHVRGLGDSGVKVWLVTPEEEPLELFGPEGAAAISPMLEARGIILRTWSHPARVRKGALVLSGGAEIFVDRVVTLPVLEGPRIQGLPHDRHGFVPVDAHGRVAGLADIYAAGDITAFPLKQGGLAAQQADAVAEVIAAAAGASVTPEPFAPVLRGLLMTGGAPLYLRCEPQRLAREVSVAIEARRPRRNGGGGSAAAGQALWWPPAKVAGRYLAPYLATARPVPFGAEPLADRVAVPGVELSDSEYQDALELALLLADCDARWGDYPSALNALDAAEALQGALPSGYEAKRREWRAAARAGG